MRKLLLVISVIFFARPVPAQTTVQLPTFSFFTASTSVLVPDRGSAPLAGMSSALDGSNYRGLGGGLGPMFNTRGLSSVRGASQISVSATIHDFEGLDEALLSTLVSNPVNPTPAQRLAAERSRAAVAGGLQSVAEIQRQQRLEQGQLVEEARHYLAQGDDALARGKAGAAKIYYQMAARRATGDLLAEVQAKLRDLNTAKQPSRIAGP